MIKRTNCDDYLETPAHNPSHTHLNADPTPVSFGTESEVDDFMTQPSPAVVDVLRGGEGNIVCLGVGGKMGHTLATLAVNAIKQADGDRAVFGVSRFSDDRAAQKLQSSGVTTITCDLLDRNALGNLPDATDVVFMAGRKFGSTGAESLTWALNVYMPGLVAERYRDARIVVFSTGNVYPFSPVNGAGADESTLSVPVGEYAQSCLGRERVFQHFSEEFGTRICIMRLNYAIDVRYGVLLDIGSRVLNRQPIDLSMGYVNVIWQGEACDRALRCLEIASSPASVLNVAGAKLSVRWIAERFGECFDIAPRFEGDESPEALLSDASRCAELFGPPRVSARQMIVWVAGWLARGGPTLMKPTGYEVRDGRF